MKKTIFLIAIVLLVPFFAHAQDAETKAGDININLNSTSLQFL